MPATFDLDAVWTIKGMDMEPHLSNADALILEPIVHQIAAREWGGSTAFTIDDVSQAIWEHIIKHPEEYIDQEVGLINYRARRAARTYCQKQRIEHMYATGGFIYTPALVRRYLQDSAFTTVENAVDVDARVDTTEAWKQLPRMQRAAIYKKYALGEPLSKAEERAESYGVNAMAHRLNTGLRMQQEDL